MKRLVILVISGASFLVLLYFISQSKNFTPAPPQQQPIGNENIIEDENADDLYESNDAIEKESYEEAFLVTDTPTEVTQGSEEPIKGPKPIPKGMVRFEITDGDWAVTQGDVLLGRINKLGSQQIFKPKKTLLWPNNVIPVAISQSLPDKTKIQEALAYFNENTSVQFVNYTGEEENYLVFTRTEEELCLSYLGMQGGAQPIRLNLNCSVQNIMHELMHALGFVHEHSRQDREDFLTVNWDNIPEKFWIQFEIVPSHLVHPYTGSVFNFTHNSIMIYPDTAFQKDSHSKTLISKTSESIVKPDFGLSEIDIERIFYLYGK
ncbi:MAG: hypothetical protein HOO06_12125 [Bdellovibrionaceae bacterium]|jgi:hypothetical protein|nr:hypothetical protein [Pseudobdellovibrionaceae bacterium]